MGRLFGTDGIRGVAGEFLTAELAVKVGRAAAVILRGAAGRRPLVLIGEDTRISSPMLRFALMAGLTACGADVMPLGVVPTPAVAHLTVKHSADAGIVISASHNSFEHNGIKIFNGQGYKLSDELEQAIEDIVLGEQPEGCTFGDLGRVIPCERDPVEDYIGHIARVVTGPLPDLKIALDCANGAASTVAPRLFEALGIRADIFHASPDGVNINAYCGSTHLEELSKTVREGGYDLGFAFDGDADRCLAVDHTGREVDGDKIMGICGLAMKAEGTLHGDAIVATVMSNMGFASFCREHGMKLLRTDVGDRNVLEEMLRGGYAIGGEQSGHLIFRQFETTGDGELAAVVLLTVLAKLGRPLDELARQIPDYPQVLVNVKISGGNPEKQRIMASEELKAAVAAAETELGETGRVLVRPSGTEPLIRVMVEANTPEKAQKTADSLADLVNKM